MKEFLRNRFGKDRGGQGSSSGKGGGHERSGGKGCGDGSKPTSGPGGFCICPMCGHKEPHGAGQRCTDQTCPTCGAKMTRE